MMQISEAIILKITKKTETSGDDSAVLVPNNSLLPIDDVLTAFTKALLDIYGKNVTGYSALKQGNTDVFPLRLKAYVGDPASPNGVGMAAFAAETMELIRKSMSLSFFATGGYGLLIRYTNQGKDWLLICMLKQAARTGIDDETMTLKSSLVFEMEKVHEAARIDLQTWQATLGAEPVEAKNYLSFIAKKSGKDGASQYFQTALSCADYSNISQHTELTIAAAMSFVDGQTDIYPTEADRAERKKAVRAMLLECFTEHREEVSLATVSALISPSSDATAFKDFVRNDPETYPINDIFKPHAATFNRLKRYKGKVGTVSLGFNVDDITNQVVSYDEASGAIMVAAPADSVLVKAIREHTPQTASPDSA